MQECFKCGVTAEKALLFDAIGKKGIVKICNKCLKEEDLPLVKSTSDFEESYNNPPSVYEKLSKMSGINAEEHRKKFSDLHNEELIRKQDVTLREIVDRNFQEKMQKNSLKDFKVQTKDMLVDNFHWILMRVRRMRKMTQSELAKELAEPEKAIKMAEMGVLPENPRELINKFEKYFGIRLFKEGFEEEPQKDLKFDPVSTKEITISDLKKDGPSFPYWKRKLGFLQRKKEDFEEEKSFGKEGIVNRDSGENMGFTIQGEKIHSNFEEKEEGDIADKEDLSDEEMDRIIFGK